MRTFYFLFVILISANVFAQSSSRFEITRSVIACGGATPSSSARFQLSSTIAQPLSAVPASDRFSIIGGFWIWPAPAMMPPTINGNNIILGIQSEAGKTYTIQWAGALGAPWQDGSSVSGNGGIVTVTNSFTNAPMQFYRVVEQQ